MDHTINQQSYNSLNDNLSQQQKAEFEEMIKCGLKMLKREMLSTMKKFLR